MTDPGPADLLTPADDSSTVEVREAVPTDVPTVVALTVEEQVSWTTFTNSWFTPDKAKQIAQQWRTDLNSPQVQCLVAQDALRVVGCWSSRPEATSAKPTSTAADAAHLSSMFVTGTHHGTGTADQLMQAGIRQLRQRQYTTVRLWVPEQHERARAFYRRHQFAANEHIRYRRGGLTRIEMRRTL